MSGYRTIILTLVLAWFFGFRAPISDDGRIFMSVVVGPMATEAECYLVKMQMMAMLELPLSAFTECRELQEANS